jgi:hypothetical protein
MFYRFQLRFKFELKCSWLKKYQNELRFSFSSLLDLNFKWLTKFKAMIIEFEFELAIKKWVK